MYMELLMGAGVTSNAIGYGGSAVTIGGAVVAAVAPDPTIQQGGYAFVVAGIGTVLVNGLIAWATKREQRISDREKAEFEFRKEEAEAERQLRRDRLAEQLEDARRKATVAERKAEALATRVATLEAGTAEVPVNTGRAKAALDILKDRGFIARPSIEDAPPHTDWPTVLLVEDDPSTIAALSGLLTQHGFDVTGARTVADAIAKLEDRPSFVLLDLKLAEPGDGLAVLEAARALDLPSKIVVVTGSQDREILGKAKALGPAAVLPKPLAWGSLMKVLQPSSGDDLPAYRGPAKGGDR